MNEPNEEMRTVLLHTLRALTLSLAAATKMDARLLSEMLQGVAGHQGMHPTATEILRDVAAGMHAVAIAATLGPARQAKSGAQPPTG